MIGRARQFAILAMILLHSVAGASTGCRPGDSDLVEVLVGETRQGVSLALPSISIRGVAFARIGASVSLQISMQQRISVLHRCICRDGDARCPEFMDTVLLGCVSVELAAADECRVALPDAYEAPGLVRTAHVLLAEAADPQLLPGVPDSASCTGLQRVTGQLALGSAELSVALGLGPLGLSVSSSAIAFEPVLACCCSGSACGGSDNAAPRFCELPGTLYFDAQGAGRLSFSIVDADGADDVVQVAVFVVDGDLLPIEGVEPVSPRVTRRADRVEVTARLRLTEVLAQAFLDRGPLWISVLVEDRCGHRVDGCVEIPESAMLFGHESPEISHVLTRASRGVYDVILHVDDGESGDTLLISSCSNGGAVSPAMQVVGGWQRLRGGSNIHLQYIPDCDEPRGAYTVTATVVDRWGLAATVVVPIPVSCSPLVRDDEVEIRSAQPFDIHLLSNDEVATGVSGELHVASASAGAHGRVDNRGTHVTYFAEPGYIGDDAFTYVACDGMGACATADVVVHCIDSPPEGPLLLLLEQDGACGAVSDWASSPGGVLLGSYHDPNGSPLRFRLVSASVRSYGAIGLRSVLAVDADLPSYSLYLRLHPADLVRGLAQESGAILDELLISVAKEEGDAAPLMVTVRVVLRNQPPIASAMSLETDDRTALVFALSAADPDGDVLRFICSDPSHGRFERGQSFMSRGVVHYLPREGGSYTDTFLFSVSDGLLTSEAEQVSILVTCSNHPPAADAGEDLAVEEGGTVVLAGRGSDPDPGDAIAGFRWEQTAGPSVELLHADTANACFEAPEQPPCSRSVYRFALVVVDTVGEASAPSSVEVTVLDSNHAPVATAVAYTSGDGEMTVHLDGSGSFDPDPQDCVVGFRWWQTDGPSVALSDGDAAETEFAVDGMSSPDGPEEYSFSLVVSDLCGEMSAVASVTVVVAGGEAALRANLDVLPPAIGRMGDDLVYRVEITNSGTLHVHDVWLFSSLVGRRYVGTLSPGERRVLPGIRHALTLDDVCDGLVPRDAITHEIWVDGVDSRGEPVRSSSAYATVPVATRGVLSIDVDVHVDPPAHAGEDLDVAVLVCNTGDVAVGDPCLQVDDVWPPYSFNDLDPGGCFAAFDLHCVTAAEAAERVAEIRARAWGEHPCGCSVEAVRTERVDLE